MAVEIDRILVGHSESFVGAVVDQIEVVVAGLLLFVEERVLAGQTM